MHKRQSSVEELEYWAEALQSLGWLLLAFDGIVVVFVFVGIRDGSLLWLDWTLIEGALGVVLLAAGRSLGERATELLGHSVARPTPATGEPERREAA